MSDIDLGKQYKESLDNFFKNQDFKNGLEIGLDGGVSTRSFLENTKGKLTTIDIAHYPETIESIEKDFKNRWRFFLGDSRQIVPGLKDEYDFIYIDGDHSGLACLADAINTFPLLEKGGIVLFDDYGYPNFEIKAFVDVWAVKMKRHEVEGNPNGSVYFIKE